MSAHTPGPWTVSDILDNGINCVTTDNPVDQLILVGTASRLTKADARLIAAAPDLLAALRTLVSRDFTYYGGFVVDCNITMEEVQRARDAIAKAEAA